MVVYRLKDAEALGVAAAEVSGLFGFGFGKEGIPVEFLRRAGGVKIDYRNGTLTVEASGRVQFLYALKLFADEYGGTGDFSCEQNANFDELTYMCDCSRNAVPKKGTLKKLIRHLAVMGYQTLGLYMEDTFVVKNQPYVGYLRTPYTREDIREIDEYCRLFGMELVPYIQTLAHFNTLVRDYALAHLFDFNDILMVGEESTYAFIEDLISTCADYFTTKKIHIGMDEAYMIGRGKYMDKHGARGRFDVMTEHLARVTEICKKYGFEKPMMWSDMFFSLSMSAQYGNEIPPEINGKMPKNVELVYWDYCSTDRNHYSEMMKKHRVFENRIGFATGAWKWLGYTPDNRYGFASCGESARACIENGIREYIVTGRGDNGAESSLFSVLPTMLYCARFNYGAFGLDDAFRKSFGSLAGMKFEDFMTIDLCNRVTRHEDVEEKTSSNKYLLFNDVLLGTLDTMATDDLGDILQECADRIGAAKRRSGQWKYVFETQYRLGRVLEIKSTIGIKLRNAYQKGDRKELAAQYLRLKMLPARIESFYRSLRAQWDAENRPNGFDVQDIRIGALKQRVAVAIKKVGDYLEGRTESVPELGEKLLCFMGHGEEFEKDFDQCEWRWRRMTSVNVNE